MMSENQSSPNESRFQRIRKGFSGELKRYLLLASYLAIWFCSISFLLTMVEGNFGIDRSDMNFPFTLALIKAAFVAKFMITAELLFPMSVNRNDSVVLPLLKHSLAYLAFVTMMSFVEKGFEGLFHSHHFFASMKNFGHGKVTIITAMMLIYWLILLHYLMFKLMRDEMGGKSLHKMLFGKS